MSFVNPSKVEDTLFRMKPWKELGPNSFHAGSFQLQ